MNKNDEILNEAFWKKKSFIGKLKDSEIQYKPVSNDDSQASLFGNDQSGNAVLSNKAEVEKRLVQALGMAMGTNTVKSMANKAIKSFPIIVSDDVSSETVVMIKNMMEEQYAAYIDLLISNQIINISDYKPGDFDGNIAVQSLEKINGTEFDKSSIARQAQTGKLSIDDLLKNNPAWQILRTNNESCQYHSGNELTDMLLENAIIVPSTDKDKAVAALGTLCENMKVINTITATGDPNVFNVQIAEYNDDATVVLSYYNTQMTHPEIVEFINKNNKDVYSITKSGYKTLGGFADDLRKEDIKKEYSDLDRYRNSDGSFEYNKLLSPSALIDPSKANDLLDKSVAEILTPSKDKTPQQNEIAVVLKDKFQKASYLLTSSRITGAEYISYVVERLGLPISNKVRGDLVLRFRSNNVYFAGQHTKINGHRNTPSTTSPGTDNYYDLLAKNIDKNEKVVLRSTNTILRLYGRDVLKVAAIGASLGAAGGVATGAAIAALISNPIGWMAIIPATIVGGIGAAIYKIRQKKQESYLNNLNKIEGWERVEFLINKMDNNVKEVAALSKLSSIDDKTKQIEFDAKENELFSNFAKKMQKEFDTVARDYPAPRIENKLAPVHENFDIRGYIQPISEAHAANNMALLEELEQSIKEDQSLYEDLILTNEAAKYKIEINQQKPGDTIIKQQKFNPKDIASVIPLYGTRDTVAYGSVEYDKRDLKDRKYNEPIILTVTFKERYSDGTYADNELTAVIGILGVVTRVPSDEMKFILAANANGKTVTDVLKTDEHNDSKNLIGKVISDFMKSNYAEKLPTSGKIWSNLNKIGLLAMANSIAGRNNGNVANAHIVFSQKEIDEVKSELGVDYLKNPKLSGQLMKKYSAFMLTVCNDALQVVYTYTDPDNISWDDAPYSAYLPKTTSDQMISAFAKYDRMHI